VAEQKASVIKRWQPHGNFSPYEVLDGAKKDVAAGRYEMALLKYDWFHRRALRYETNPYGPRLTSALAGWAELAELYPPAKAQLVATRDATDRKLRMRGGGLTGGTQGFLDIEAINRHLGETEHTAKTFLWLDRNRPLIAERTFEMAMPALVKAREYKICGKYMLDGRALMAKRHRLYRNIRQLPGWKSYAEAQFERDAATIIAVLTINRAPQYQVNALAALALRHLKTPTMKRTLDRALAGKVPKQE
jgi:hypothetical protein